jgi:hypothetical protein
MVFSLLAEDKDRFGLPVAHVSFNLRDNDKRLIKAGNAAEMKVEADEGIDQGNERYQPQDGARGTAADESCKPCNAQQHTQDDNYIVNN